MSEFTEEEYNWAFQTVLKQLVDSNNQLAAKDRQLAAKDRQLAEKDQQLAAKDRQLAEKEKQICLAKRKREQFPEEDEDELPTTTLENFLQNGEIEFHADYYMVQTEFQRLYKQYCKSNDIVARTLKRDYYEAPFMKRNLTVVRDTKIDPIENVPKQANWILGVRANEDAEFFEI